MPDKAGGVSSALNAQQRRAIDFDSGPLVVLAGPGTGKTRVITHRIERIIKGGANPESVVALTFTVKAAEQLRSRLAELVGPAAADRVHAHTFHGFGLRLVRRFPDYLGLGSDPVLIDSAQVRRLLRSIIREHNLFPELIPAGRDQAIVQVTSVISDLANHGLFPEDAERMAAAWKDRIAASPDKLDEAGLAAERERQARFAQCAEAYGLYAAACRERGWMTFDDLILWPIGLLRDHPPAAALCRDEYRHVVVDEFQDVNAAQIGLLRLLCPPGSRRGAGPDLCVVGDDDQSIYEFRGADDLAFLRFEKTWGTTPEQRVALTQNYRSQRPIISVANAIMARAEHRFAPDKVVELPEGKHDQPPATGAGVECVSLDDDYQAGEVIAAMILADRQANPQHPWSNHAVIARGHIDLDRIGSALQMEGIPVRRSRGQSALDDRGVKDVLRWIELLVHPASDATATFAIQWLLTRPPYLLPPDQVNDWVQAYKAGVSRAKIGGENVQLGLLDWLVEHHGSDRGPGHSVIRLATLASELRRVATQSTAETAVFEIIKRSDVAHAELLPAKERARRIGHLAEIVRFVRSRIDALDPPADLVAFWSYYQDLSEEEQAFTSSAADRVDGLGENGDEPPPAVTLLTAHSAKGLEFDTVFVPRVRAPHGYPNSRVDEEEGLPEHLLDRMGDSRSAKDRRAAEERRLFYVAATRAERRLVMLAAKRKSRTKNTDYFNEISMDDPCRGIVNSKTGDEVLTAAAELGVRLSTRTPLDEAATGLMPLSPEDRREVLEAARHRARLGAARALDLADRPDAVTQDLKSAAAALAAAAEELAITAHIEAHGAAPSWALDRGEGSPAAVYAAKLAEQVRRGPDDGDVAAALFRPLKAPLDLSYSWIEEFHRCPRCFYLRRVLRIPEPAGQPQIVGTVVHDSLAEYYRRCQRCEADGRARPGLEALLELARAEFLRQTPSRLQADEGQLEQVLGQLRLTFAKLIDPAAEVEEVERSIRFPYPHTLTKPDGAIVKAVHNFEAKIDRLDRLPGAGAGHRIVDYKTGKPWKKLLEPAADDLQLGIYAMAVRRHQEGLEHQDGPDALTTPAKGVAEYWSLSTGQRGAIDLTEIDYEKVKEKIDEAISGMLLGPFPRGELKPGGCWDLCAMFVG